VHFGQNNIMFWLEQGQMGMKENVIENDEEKE
jgi:hypothetical protein